jgi:hypothetical protein
MIAADLAQLRNKLVLAKDTGADRQGEQQRLCARDLARKRIAVTLLRRCRVRWRPPWRKTGVCACVLRAHIHTHTHTHTHIHTHTHTHTHTLMNSRFGAAPQRAPLASSAPVLDVHWYSVVWQC